MRLSQHICVYGRCLGSVNPACSCVVCQALACICSKVATGDSFWCAAFQLKATGLQPHPQKGFRVLPHPSKGRVQPHPQQARGAPSWTCDMAARCRIVVTATVTSGTSDYMFIKFPPV
jgi:hypothetical protein